MDEGHRKGIKCYSEGTSSYKILVLASGMKILQVCPRYYPSVGGVEYVVKSVAERLAKRGNDVVVLCGDSKIAVPKDEWINGVHVFRWPVWSPGDAYHIPKMRSKLKRWLLNIGKECDVVHFHSIHSVLTVYSLEVLKSWEARKVLTPHYHGTGHTLFRRILWQAWRGYVRRALHFVSLIHTVSGVESKLILQDFNVESITIEHGVEEWLSEIGWSPLNYAMYSGRIEKYKNVHRLANIMKRLNSRGLDLELKIFGRGSYTCKLIKHLDKLKINYELKPPQPYREYITYLSRATLFGLLSEKEAYGLTVNEANAIGVPVIVAEPWGLNFSGRSRTLITQLYKSDEELTQEITTFLEEARKQCKPEVPSWNQVVDAYIKRLYCP
jgi:glycosyltransferase involved in cell wall biosynthesis